MPMILLTELIDKTNNKPMHSETRKPLYSLQQITQILKKVQNN